MTEIITQTKAEDAIAGAYAFLQTERGTDLDGDFAGRQVAERVASVRERAEAFLQATPHPTLAGLYIPLSRHNVAQFDEAAATLPGHMVLVPSKLVDAHGPSQLYPAVVSEAGLASGAIRLHVLRQQYRRHVSYGASVILSAAGQSETAGIGDHGRVSSDGVEAEHFATLLAAGSDRIVQAAWQAGEHANHLWRRQASNSVVSEMSKRLFGEAIPQQTITIGREAVAANKAMLLWHEGMRDEQTGMAETATKDSALLVIQGLGYEALRQRGPQDLNIVKQLIA